MLNKLHKKESDEKPAMTADEIREFREKERMDSVCPDQSSSKEAIYTALNYIVAFAAGAVILVAMYYESMLISYLRSFILPHLSMIDDSAGFLADMLTAILNLILFTVIAVAFGFALDINYSGHGRPDEVWKKYIKFILPAAFGSCFIYVVMRHLIAGGSFGVSGTVLSRCLYYFNMIAVTPAANILLYLVLPSAVIRMLLTVVSDTKERAELPLTVVSTLIMALSLLGITFNHIETYGLAITFFTLIQSAACSLLYHRTNVIRYTILLYSGVSALYLLLAALMNSVL